MKILSILYAFYLKLAERMNTREYVPSLQGNFSSLPPSSGDKALCHNNLMEGGLKYGSISPGASYSIRAERNQGREVAVVDDTGTLRYYPSKNFKVLL